MSEPTRLSSVRAQSTILGTVLLLVIIVLSVGVVSVAAIYPGLQTSEEPIADLKPTVTTSEAELTHAGGDSFEADSLTVYLYPGATDGIAFESEYGESRFVPADVWQTSVDYDLNDQVRVLVVHEPTNSVVTDEYVRVQRAQELTASFTFSPESPKTLETVSFDASGSFHPEGSISGYEWAFGDGATATGQTATHSYGDDGSYEVTLTVTGSGGETDTTSRTVFVQNQRPTASFTYDPTQPDTDETVNFDAGGSSDPDGSITNYAWEFGDGTTASGVNPSHSYSAAGTYEVNLTVTDDDGATRTVSDTVTVTTPGNSPPTASFSYDPQNPNPNQGVTFDASGSSDSDGSISSYEWDFGDGNTASGQTATHSYGSPGTYEVTLTVTDDDGATATTSKEVQVGPGSSPPGFSSVSVTDISAGQSSTIQTVSFSPSESKIAGGDKVTIDLSDAQGWAGGPNEKIDYQSASPVVVSGGGSVQFVQQNPSNAKLEYTAPSGGIATGTTVEIEIQSVQTGDAANQDSSYTVTFTREDTGNSEDGTFQVN